MRPEICIILNSRSGPGDRESPAERLQQALDSAGVAAEIRVVGNGIAIDAMAARARDEGFRVVTAAGGDGTIAAVAAALTRGPSTLGVLPMGTFNYFARSLDIPEDLEAAVTVLRDGVARPTRIATINGEVFLNNASLGAYPSILQNREMIYARWGRSRIAAYWSVIKTLITLRRPLAITMHARGRTRHFQTPLVFAMNNVFQLRQMGLQGAEKVSNGDLAIFVAPRAGRWKMIRSACALMLGAAREHVDFELISGDEIELHCNRKRLVVARDGERSRLTGPLKLRVCPGALRVMAPAAAAATVR